MQHYNILSDLKKNIQTLSPRNSYLFDIVKEEWLQNVFINEEHCYNNDCAVIYHAINIRLYAIMLFYTFYKNKKERRALDSKFIYLRTAKDFRQYPSLKCDYNIEECLNNYINFVSRQTANKDDLIKQYNKTLEEKNRILTDHKEQPDNQNLQQLKTKIIRELRDQRSKLEKAFEETENNQHFDHMFADRLLSGNFSLFGSTKPDMKVGESTILNLLENSLTKQNAQTIVYEYPHILPNNFDMNRIISIVENCITLCNIQSMNVLYQLLIPKNDLNNTYLSFPLGYPAGYPKSTNTLSKEVQKFYNISYNPIFNIYENDDEKESEKIMDSIIKTDNFNLFEFLKKRRNDPVLVQRDIQTRTILKPDTGYNVNVYSLYESENDLQKFRQCIENAVDDYVKQGGNSNSYDIFGIIIDISIILAIVLILIIIYYNMESFGDARQTSNKRCPPGEYIGINFLDAWLW